MASSPSRRLTRADDPLIIACRAQHYSTAVIAKELGCNVRQMQRALRELGLSRGPKRAVQEGNAPISWEQYQVTRWYEQHTFTSRYLAERLGAGWIDLDHEVRGVRRARKARIAALMQLIKELDPEATFSTEPPA